MDKQQASRLTKLLMMTTSDNDGEALVALRKANEMMRAKKISWMDVFGTKDAPKSHNNHHYTAPSHQDDYDFMIDEVLDCSIPPKTAELMRSFQDFFRKNGRLSNKQIDVFESIYARYVGV